MNLKSSALAAALTATALLCVSSAPRARELCGVIQAIDAQSHALTIQSPKRDRPLTVVWKRDTGFINNWKFADSASLKEGMRVCIYYRSPLFGKPFVTKVVWVDEQSAKNPSL